MKREDLFSTLFSDSLSLRHKHLVADHSHLAVLQIHHMSNQVELRSKFSRGSSLRRSSYALSQGAGPGRLITSGKCFRSTDPLGGEKVADNPSATQGQTHLKDNNHAANGT